MRTAATVGAFAALLTLPAMIASRGIAPTMLVLVTILLMAGVLRQGHLDAMLIEARAAAKHPAVVLAAAFLGLLVLSTLWSPNPGRGGLYAVQMAGTGLAAALCLAAIGSGVASAPRAVAVAGVLAASGAVIVADSAADGSLRGTLGLSTDIFRLNRAAVFIVLLLPLATWLAAREGRRWLLVPAWGLGVWAVISSESESAKLALLLVGGTLPLTLLWPTAGAWVIGAAVAGATLAMPVIALHINAAIPDAIHTAVGYGTLTIRGEIWQAYSSLIEARPVLGFGVEAGHVAAFLPQALDLTPEERGFLGWSHPHNGVLQIWFELGAAGALLFALWTVLLVRQIARSAGPLAPYALATFMAAYAVFVVSHGAWQAWWWAVLALVALLYAAASADPDSRSG